jgi:hypothetical protein
MVFAGRDRVGRPGARSYTRRQLGAFRGNIGIEAAVSLGASPTADTTPEVRVARAVLGNIHG